MAKIFKTTVATVATLAVIIGSSALIGGCNTTKGAGKDIEKTGDAIQDAAS